MSRVRVLVTETSISKAGQFRHFQIKLSKHAYKIVAVETDVRVKSPFDASGIPGGHEVNPNVAGKLSLQSMEKENIFFSDWVKVSLFSEEFKSPIAFNIHSGLKDIRGKTAPKKVDVPIESTVINALYCDNIGKELRRDIEYRLKVFVWMETNESQNGVDFEFLNPEKQ